MAQSINRYYRPQQAQYISQYADYKLPYEAVQNAVIGRQNKFDANQLALAQSAAKYAQLASRDIDAAGKQREIDNWLDSVHQTVNEKYGGDFSLASGDIYNSTAKFAANPMWSAMQTALEDDKAYKQAKATALMNEKKMYNKHDFTGDRSVFADDGSLQEANYSYIPVDGERWKGVLRKEFEDKQLDKYSTANLKAMNEAAESMTPEAFIGWYEIASRSFDKDYLAGALESVKAQDPNQYQMYVDQGLAQGMTLEKATLAADAQTALELAQQSKEFEVNQQTLRTAVNPGWVAPGARVKTEAPTNRDVARNVSVANVVDDKNTIPSTYEETKEQTIPTEKLPAPNNPYDARNYAAMNKNQFNASLNADRLNTIISNDPIVKKHQDSYDISVAEDLPVAIEAFSKKYAGVFGNKAVSYTHLTLPTILRV